MLPLVQKLPLCFRDRTRGPSDFDDESSVERVAAELGFIGNRTEVAGDARHRVGGVPKPLQLGVSRVAARATEQHRLCKKGLPPQRNEPDGIEVARMDSPETHDAV